MLTTLFKLENHSKQLQKSKLTLENVKNMGELHYLNKILKLARFGLLCSKFIGEVQTKPAATPVAIETKLLKATELFDITLYQGMLQITFAVSNVARFCSKSTKEHWVTIKRTVS